MPLPKLPHKSYDIILDSVLGKLGSDFTVTREVGAVVRYRVAYQGEDLLEFTISPSPYNPHNEKGCSFGQRSLIIEKVYGRTFNREDWTEKEKLLLGKAHDVLRKVKTEMDGYAHLAPMVKSAIAKKEAQEASGETVEEESTTSETLADDILPDKLKRGGRYGTCRDITTDEVRKIVARCKGFQAKGGKVTTFFDQLNIYPGEPRSFTLETLRDWLKDPRFTEE